MRIPPAKIEVLPTETDQRPRETPNRLLSPWGVGTGDGNGHLVMGGAAAAIAPPAKRSDTDPIVMGTVGRTGVARLFTGIAAGKVRTTTRISRLAVMPEGFSFPVTMP